MQIPSRGFIFLSTKNPLSGQLVDKSARRYPLVDKVCNDAVSRLNLIQYGYFKPLISILYTKRYIEMLPNIVFSTLCMWS